jgi:uncharacterized protein (TIGR03435 family)
MKSDVNGHSQRIDEVVKRHLPSARKDEMNAGAARVLRRLHAVTARADRGESERIAALDVVAVPTGVGWHRARMLAAAAAVLLVFATTLMWRQSRGPVTSEAIDSSPNPGVGQDAQATDGGDLLEIGETVRTDEAGATMTLADGSRVEMRARSELALERADDGLRIRLKEGSIIVNAAKQPSGHLYVQTKDMTVSVVGTVFLVNAEAIGSRVAVIEGEVRVRGGKTDARLRPGEQFATSSVLSARPVKGELAWSRYSGAYQAILDSFAKGMADTAGSLSPLGGRRGVRATQNQAGRSGGRQEYEEASIRLCDPDNLPVAPSGGRGGGANSFQMTPGRTNILCMTAATIIRTAYGYSPADLEFMGRGGRGRGMSFNTIYGLGVEDGVRVRGGPDWVRSDRYTVEAIADPSADAEAMSRAMLQALLERRFQLKAHIESEQVPAFSLVVAKGGLKIKPVADDACEPIPPVRSPADRPRSAAEVRRGEKPTRGLTGSRNGPNFVSVGGRVGLSGLASVLGNNLGGVRVLDNTGITDNFSFVLEFVIDENTPQRFGGPPQQAAEPSDVPRAPTIFTAIEEQLGLRLEPARAPRDFIVVDSIARPSPN